MIEFRIESRYFRVLVIQITLISYLRLVDSRHLVEAEYLDIISIALPE